MAQQFAFVKNDDEAEAVRRAKQFKSTDPFPSIPRALLSSAEIHDYVRVTAMLHPFDQKKGFLKPASYEARAGGEYTIWHADGKREKTYIERDDHIRLPRNSIAFVQTETVFRLPHYIALRFNLRITHVHRGILLGTGPLVDPGFEGQLLIPLHNLTDSDYYIDTTTGLIWIEFTKTTYEFEPDEEEASKPRNFCEFPESKCFKKSHYYFEKANKSSPIRSSLPSIIKEANDVTKEVRSYVKVVEYAGLIAFLAIISALGAIVFQGYDLLTGTWSEMTSLSEEISEVHHENQLLRSELKKIQLDIQSIRDAVSNENAE